MTPKQAAATAKKIKIGLIQAGITQADIARQRNVSAAQVNRVIHDPSIVSDHVRSAIAAAIGETKENLWPHYYKVRGSRPKNHPIENPGLNQI